MKVNREIPIVLIGAAILSASLLSARQLAAARSAPDHRKEWPGYGGGPADIRYSPLKQINRSNVGQLQVAWTFEPGEGNGGTQSQPLVADGVLYAVTPRHNVVALEPATGKQIWKWDAGLNGRGANRGLAY